LEKAGVPTALVCSDEFGPLARAESQTFGFGGLPLVGIPHPLAGNSAELVRAKASAAAAEVLAALTTSSAELADTYRDRFVRATERRSARGVVCTDEACAVDPASFQRTTDV
jgi:hypothetical protein